MPGQDSIARAAAFVARKRELAELLAGIDDAKAGRGRLFAVVGEAGVGKTRLTDMAANHAAAQGATVLWGRCWEHGGAPAYWPWMQVLRSLAGGTEPGLLADWLGAGAGEIAQILPELSETVTNLPVVPNAALAQPDRARFRLFDSVTSLLHKAATTRPLLIVLDDLHAADPTSLLMLVAVARQIRSASVMIVVTYREVEIKQSPELSAAIADIEREGAVFSLRGLAKADIAELVELGWGMPAKPALVGLLHDATEGNPFFLHEVLRDMAADGQITSETPRRESIPHGVREYARKVTEPLSETTRKVLGVAAVIGRDFDLASLEAASRVQPEQLIELLDKAVALELIIETHGAAGSYCFRHSLIREALYDALSPATRRVLHRTVGETLRGAGEATETLARIAYHYRQSASLGDTNLAIEYSQRAARAAEAQLAYEEAASHFRNSVEMLVLANRQDEPLYAELMCDLSEAQYKAGDAALSRKTCLAAAEHARRLADTGLFVRTTMVAGRAISNSGVTDHALVGLLNEARNQLGDDDSPPRAQILARLGIELYWTDRTQAVTLCHSAAEMARRLGDPRTLIITLWGRHLSLRNPDSLQQRLADTREVITIAERAGERDFALEVRFYRIADLIEAGDVLAADIEQAEYLMAEEDLRDRYKRGLLLRGMRALADGRLDDAMQLAHEALLVGKQSGRPLAMNSFFVQQGSVLTERGQSNELERPLRAFIAENPRIVYARCALLFALASMGRLDEAREGFETLARDEFGIVPRDWNWLPSMFLLADMCGPIAATAHAETLYRLLLPYAARNTMIGYVCTYGSVALVLGELAALQGRSNDAIAHFETALAANRAIRAAVWVARTQGELAAALLARGQDGDHDRARALIAAARSAADALGLLRVQKRLAEIDTSNPRSPPQPARLAPPAAAADGAGLQGLIELATARARETSAQALIDNTVTILFSDIVDSARLFDRLGDLRAHEVISIHSEIVRQQIEAFRGHEVKTLGDSFMVAFPSARRAALCAIAVQRAMAAYNEHHPDLPIRVRVGLHSGEAINDSADFYGRAVIVAARIAAHADGGRILVSSMVRDLAADAGDLCFVPAGIRQLKGLAGDYQLFELDCADGSNTDLAI